MAYHKNAPSPRKAPFEPEDLERIWQKFSRLKEIHDEFYLCLPAGSITSSSLNAYLQHDRDALTSLKAELLRLTQLAASAPASSKLELTYKAKIAFAMAEAQNNEELQALMSSLIDDIKSSK